MPHHLHRITITDHRLTTPDGGGIHPVVADLDLPENFGHLLQNSIEELNDINEVKREGALSFTLRKTTNNEYLLERFGSVTIAGNTYKAVQVEAWVDHVKLRYDRLLVSLNSDRDRSYECSLADSEEVWFEKAEKTYLADLDLGTFTYTKGNVRANMENNARYQPGNDLLYLPLADYGNGGVRIGFTGSDIEFDFNGFLPDAITVPGHGLPLLSGTFNAIFSSDGRLPSPLTNNSVHAVLPYDENKVLLVDEVNLTDRGDGQHYINFSRWDICHIRPFFSVPGLLTEGFSQIGWQLKGEILQHEDVQRWWDYILDKEFYATGGNEAFYFTQAELAADQPQADPGGGFLLGYDTIAQEEYGNVTDHNSGTVNSIVLNDTGQKLDAALTADITIENTNGTPITVSVGLTVFEENIPAGAVLHETGETTDIPIGGQHTFSLKLDAVMEVGNYALVQFAKFSPAGTVNYTVKAGSSFRCQPRAYPKCIVKGSTHENAGMIDPALTLMDRFKAFLHLGDFKLKTDFDLKTVTVYPSENTVYEGAALEGFWRPATEARDMTPYIEKHSRNLTPPTDAQPRFVHLKFKDPTDDYITEVLQASNENTGLYGRTLDFGDRFTGPDATVENPLYEPTAEKQSGAAIVPALWDNDRGNESYNLKPRIVYAVGWVRQKLRFTLTGHVDTNGNSVDPYTIDESFRWFEGSYEVYVPYVSQLPETVVFVLPFPEYLPNKNIIYGIRDNDLYNSFWSLDRFVRFTLPEVAFLVRMGLEEFTAEDFRQRWFVLYKGEPATYRLVQLLEHETNNDNSTEAVLLPEPDNTI